VVLGSQDSRACVHARAISQTPGPGLDRPTHRRAASPASSHATRRPGHRGHTHAQTQHRPVPSPTTGRSPWPRRHRRCHRATAAVTAHATATSRPGARERLYAISSSASLAFAHTHSLHTHEHTHTYLPHQILLVPMRGSDQSTRRGGGGGEAAQPDTAHGATGPEDVSARDESEAQPSLLNPESACELNRVVGPDQASPSLSTQKWSRAPFPFSFFQPDLWTPPVSLEVRLTGGSH
jgi:hypothetical protein